MKHLTTKQLRIAVSEYAQPDTVRAIMIFMTDLVIYLSAIAGVIFLESIALRILCCVLAGTMISSLFVIGHDAAHNAFTGNKTLNKVIARIAFLPSLHNYGLWLTEHNRIHHQVTNIQGANSWSPLSKEEYDVLPAWRQRLERFYRSLPGIGIYYLIERWWKHKFYPHKGIVGKYNSVYRDFILVSAYLAGFLGLLGYLGQQLAHTTPVELIVLGFLLPFINWNYLMGFTVYQHHTHESIPWVKTRHDRDYIGGQEDFTMHVRYPGWYNLISHNIMEHTAHHVDPRIPLYHLPKAQARLSKMLADDMKVIKFSFKDFIQTLSNCKLYDYKNQCWLDFEGNVTSRIEIDVDTGEEDYRLKAA